MSRRSPLPDGRGSVWSNVPLTPTTVSSIVTPNPANSTFSRASTQSSTNEPSVVVLVARFAGTPRKRGWDALRKPPRLSRTPELLQGNRSLVRRPDFRYTRKITGGVAQLGERRVRNAKVEGTIFQHLARSLPWGDLDRCTSVPLVVSYDPQVLGASSIGNVRNRECS